MMSAFRALAAVEPVPVEMTALPPIPQVSPGAAYQAYRAEIDTAIARVMTSGHYVLGEQVDGFEKAFAQYVGTRHAIGVANGTDALALALRALGVKPGDAVATVSHTAVATVAAIMMIGAVPVLVDIGRNGYTMDPSHLADTLARRRVAAVVVVHLYGQPADMDAIVEITRAHGAVLVEDCAQAHGARWKGQSVGTFGDAAAFSFYPTKNLGAFGDGGAVTCHSDVIAEQVRGLRQYGWRAHRISEMPGVNSRLDELQAAMLRVRLAHLDEDNQRRVQIAARYDSLLANCQLRRPPHVEGTEPVFHQYVVAATGRDRLRELLSADGIGTAIHYADPAHRQPGCANAEQGPGGLPNTERAAGQILSLPMFPQLSQADVDRVAQAVARAVRQ